MLGEQAFQHEIPSVLPTLSPSKVGKKKKKKNRASYSNETGRVLYEKPTHQQIPIQIIEYHLCIVPRPIQMNFELQILESDIHTIHRVSSYIQN